MVPVSGLHPCGGSGTGPHLENIGNCRVLLKWQGQSGCPYSKPGTGTGYSVLDMVQAFEQASGRPVPYRIALRRPGDIASCYADPNWRAIYSVGGRSVGWTLCVRMPGAGKAIILKDLERLRARKLFLT